MGAIRLVIFDLDDCILDTDTFRPHMRARMKQVLDAFDVPQHVREHAERVLGGASPIAAAYECDLPVAVQRALLESYRGIDMPMSLATYGDEHHVREIDAERILVTAGFESVQYGKIRSVGIAGLFSEIHVIPPGTGYAHHGKQLKFQELMKERSLESWEVVVVGDSPQTELRAGLTLGLITVQTLRPSIIRWERANFHITSLAELPALIKSIENGES